MEQGLGCTPLAQPVALYLPHSHITKSFHYLPRQRHSVGTKRSDDTSLWSVLRIKPQPWGWILLRVMCGTITGIKGRLRRPLQEMLHGAELPRAWSTRIL